MEHCAKQTFATKANLSPVSPLSVIILIRYIVPGWFYGWNFHLRHRHATSLQSCLSTTTRAANLKFRWLSFCFLFYFTLCVFFRSIYQFPVSPFFYFNCLTNPSHPTTSDASHTPLWSWCTPGRTQELFEESARHVRWPVMLIFGGKEEMSNN